MKWGLSVLDWRSHAIDECRHHPIGVLKAECGHRLMMVTTLYDRPYSTPCEACAALQLARVVIPVKANEIPGRPPVELPPTALPAAGRSRLVKALGQWQKVNTGWRGARHRPSRDALSTSWTCAPFCGTP